MSSSNRYKKSPGLIEAEKRATEALRRVAVLAESLTLANALAELGEQVDRSKIQFEGNKIIGGDPTAIYLHIAAGEASSVARLASGDADFFEFASWLGETMECLGALIKVEGRALRERSDDAPEAVIHSFRDGAALLHNAMRLLGMVEGVLNACHESAIGDIAEALLDIADAKDNDGVATPTRRPCPGCHAPPDEAHEPGCEFARGGE